jgi:uncharacterized protein
MKYKLILFFISVITLTIVGRIILGNFSFLISEFWFTAGLFLILLLSLVDQPYFSKDQNVFVNSVTACMSLFILKDKTIFWYSMLVLVLLLLLSSYTLLWIRRDSLKKEPKIIGAVTRIIRTVGRPECLFSIFFFWGVIEKFTYSSKQANTLFIFWSVFILLNLPAISNYFNELLSKKLINHPSLGILISITNPSAAFVGIRSDCSVEIGDTIEFVDKKHRVLSRGSLIDDRVVANSRIGKVAIYEYVGNEKDFSNSDLQPISINIVNDSSSNKSIISIVDAGTMIGKVVFFINPHLLLEAGELVWVKMSNGDKAYYQIVVAEIVEEKIEEQNEIQYIKVSAGQLGKWDESYSRFEPVKWVAQAGEIVYKENQSKKKFSVPEGCLEVGEVPNSDFPVHVSIDELVTHNCAILGVTGCGKSYLAFHLIEGLILKNIKVMILDSSRQHYLYLQKYKPFPLKEIDDIEKWINSDSQIGIHQFAIGTSYPEITANFVTKAFEIVSSKTKLKPGINEPAKLCFIFEEAHSLIPEWNQVAEDSDKRHVNRTARVILQGRKFGIGSIIITQRTANVTKTILNQCNTIFAMQSFDQTGLDFLQNYMGSDYANTISTMPKRHSILVGKASSSNRPIMFQIKELDYKLPSQTSENAAKASSIDGE